MVDTPDWFTRPDGLRLAYRYQPGKGPAIVFLPGYASDMDGDKALALSAWATAQGRAMLRLDYSGCGLSEGRFDDGTLASWRDDALAVIEHCVQGRFVTVGSSMGGWIALLIALAKPAHTSGLIGIAAAPDFTDWGYTPEEKQAFIRDGRVERANPYGPEAMRTTQAFWESGQDNLLMSGEVPINCSVRLLQGQCDDVVPWEKALQLQSALRSDDVQVSLVKDGDHRLSRPQDIALLLSIVASLPEL